MAWQQLADIAREAVIEAARQQSQTPAACPNDGEPLTRGAGGVLFCKYDGWRYE